MDALLKELRDVEWDLFLLYRSGDYVFDRAGVEALWLRLEGIEREIAAGL